MESFSSRLPSLNRRHRALPRFSSKRSVLEIIKQMRPMCALLWDVLENKRSQGEYYRQHYDSSISVFAALLSAIIIVPTPKAS
jgi:hypothetical protein